MKRTAPSLALAFALGVVAAGAFHLMLEGVIRDEYQLVDSPLLDWSWLPFMAGSAMAVLAALALLVARRR